MSTLFLPMYLAACAVYGILDLQLVRGLKRLGARKPQAAPPRSPTAANLPVITVLIAARDEERDLPRVLEALMAQDYPREKFHVVVANDRSTDGTEAVLTQWAASYPDHIDFVNVATLPEGWAPKKHALLRGLERARGEWIAVTDADSEMGPGWLSALSREFEAGVGMVVGFTAYRQDGDSLPGPDSGQAAGVRALEFSSLGITGAALVGLGFPVIANANNLAYRRSAFDEAGAFDKHGSVVSGDDDFTLQEIHATGNWEIRFCAAPEALMRTAAPETWRPFWEQRKRWVSKCFHYRPAQVIFLLAIFAFYLSIQVLLVAGIWFPLLGLLGIVGFAAKTLGDLWVMWRGLKLFGLSHLLRYFPLTALLHIPLIVGVVTAGMFGTFTWKGQRFKTKV